MVINMEIPSENGKPPRNIYQRRAYAAQRAMTAIDKYSFLASAQKSDEEKQRALRWMRAWMAFAISHRESSVETATRIATGSRR